MKIPPLNGLPLEQYLKGRISSLKYELKEHEKLLRKIKK